MNKRFLSIALLLTLFLPMAGTLGWLHLQKWKVRKDVKERIIAGIGRGQLVQIRLTADQAATLLEWEHDGEFRYRGEMYDVVDTRMEGNFIRYWCWPDRRETLLNQHLEDLLARALENDPLREKSEGQVISFLKTLFFEPPPTLLFIAPQNQGEFPYPFCDHYRGIPPGTPTPPPDLG